MNEPAPLSDLAGRINAEHAACMAAARDAVIRAIEVGRLLAEAKQQVRHGGWEPWVEANCAFGVRQAQSYMRAYHNRGLLEEQIRSGASHLTGLRGAMAMLAAPEAAAADDDPDAVPRRRPTPIGDMPEANRHRLCENWWDQRAKYTVMLEAAGWEPDAIAAFLGRPVEDITAILEPRLPARFDSEGNGLWMFADDATPEQRARMAEYYRDNVTCRIDFWMETAYSWARLSCENDGFADVAPILEAGERRHRRRREAAEARGIWPFTGFVGDAELDGAFWWCTIFDARHAVRIPVDETDHGDWHAGLGAMFVRQCEALEGLNEKLARK
jgi:hypothetical protein